MRDWREDERTTDDSTPGGCLAGGTLYVNGVRADGLRNFDFRDVGVRIDENGDVWVDAPNYKIEVTGGSADAEAEPVEAGQWWMVSQDNNSGEHSLQILINGELVKDVKSGDAQLILDLAPYLKKGDNTLLINAMPSSTPTGGDLMIYVGAGSNSSGTVSMSSPDVVYARGASASTSGGSRSYTLTIP
jgi:hypothetical protein